MGWEQLAPAVQAAFDTYWGRKEATKGREHQLEMVRMQLKAAAEEAKRDRDFERAERLEDRANKLSVQDLQNEGLMDRVKADIAGTHALHATFPSHFQPASINIGMEEFKYQKEQDKAAKMADVYNKSREIWTEIVPWLKVDAPFDELNTMLQDSKYIGKSLPIKEEEWKRLSTAHKTELLHRFARYELGDELLRYGRGIGLDANEIKTFLGWEYYGDINWKEWVNENKESILEQTRKDTFPPEPPITGELPGDIIVPSKEMPFIPPGLWGGPSAEGAGFEEEEEDDDERRRRIQSILERQFGR